MKNTSQIFFKCVIFLCASAAIIFSSHTSFSKAPKQINVRDFGAKGDGKTDDYKSLLAVVDYVNKNKGGTVFFPKGNYFINVYHTKGSSLKDFEFKNCIGLYIKGDAAIITLNGKFKRKVDYISGKNKFSLTNSIIPLSFVNSTDVRIEGIEINGNVNQMSRESVLESGGHLLRFNSCTNVTVRNCTFHHAQTDGIYITGAKSADFLFQNVRSSNNARQGMSIIMLKNGRFENCKFINTGITNGNYCRHSPSSGVDIEPHGKKLRTVDNIYFKKCLFENNVGGQFICTAPTNTSNVTLDDCEINANESIFKYQIILAAINVTITNSKIDCGLGSIYPVWGRMNGSDVTIKGCEIKSKSNGIISVSKNDKNKVLIQNNTMFYTGAKVMTSYFPYLQTKELSFIDNKIVIPQKFLNSKKPASLVQKAKISSGNTFFGNNGVKIKVSYTGTRLIKDK